MAKREIEMGKPSHVAWNTTLGAILEQIDDTKDRADYETLKNKFDRICVCQKHSVIREVAVGFLFRDALNTALRQRWNRKQRTPASVALKGAFTNPTSAEPEKGIKSVLGGDLYSKQEAAYAVHKMMRQNEN
jgi:hypothetical protein